MALFENDTLHLKFLNIIYRFNPKPSYTEKGRYADGLILYVKGGHRIDFADRALETSAGDLLYLPYREVYGNRITENTTEYFQLDFLLYENGSPARLFDTPRLFSADSAEKALPVMRRLYEETAAAATPLLRLVDTARLIALVKNEGAGGNGSGDGMDRIRNAVSYIDEHYREDTPVTALAAMTGMCVSNLEKLFRKHLGLTPCAYRSAVRVRHAKMLLAGGCTVFEAAQLSGFTDPFYFSRLFRKITGCAPETYKNQTVDL